MTLEEPCSLAPHDAYFLYFLHRVAPFQDAAGRTHPYALARYLQQRFNDVAHWPERDILASLDLLRGLSLIYYEQLEAEDRNGGDDPVSSVSITVTQYCCNFVEACIPNQPAA